VSVWAIVPAAGRGSRFGGPIPEQYLAVAGRAVLAHVIDLFMNEPAVAGVAVAVAADDSEWARVAPRAPAKPLVVARGGPTRADSVLAALDAIAAHVGPRDWALVHDAARPLLDPADLARLIEVLADDPVGGILAAPVVDTLKRADADGRVAETAERDGLWRALTPQMFRYGLLRAALAEAIAAGVAVTDEAMAVERTGHAPRLVPGGTENIKITSPEDVAVVDAVLRARTRAAQ
jgi:2-C-methyl-D-erythritol 4-phosphate cytidylyltransferase